MAKLFDERKLLKTVTLSIKVKETRKHKVLKAIGLWLAKIGFWIYGIGEVKVESEE